MKINIPCYLEISKDKIIPTKDLIIETNEEVEINYSQSTIIIKKEEPEKQPEKVDTVVAYPATMRKKETP